MINGFELVTNKTLREECIAKVEVLDKVKALILLPNDTHVTTEMVANYFEVSTEVINKLVQRNTDELMLNGYEKFEGEQLKDIKSTCKIQSRARSLSVFTRRTVLNVAMLLRDSEIAKEIRSKLLDTTETKETVKNIVDNVDQEKLLMMEIAFANNEEERMLALSKLREYKNKQIAIAEEKVGNLIKNDETFGIREAKNNLGVKERNLTLWLETNKYIYRSKKVDKLTGKEKNGRIKPYGEYTVEPTRYFVEKFSGEDRNGINHKTTYITIDGIEFLRTKVDEINKIK